MNKLKIAIAIVAGFFFATQSMLDFWLGPAVDSAAMRFNLLAWAATQKLQYLSP